MTRKLKYVATKQDGSTEVLGFDSLRQAMRFVDNNPEYKDIKFAEDPKDIAYLSKISKSYLKKGEDDLYVIAEPFTSAKFWKNPRDTHRMNIVDMLPGYIAYQWYINNDEYDEAEEYLDNQNYFQVMGIWPEQIIGKTIKDANPKEIESLIKFMIKNLYGGLKLMSSGHAIPYSLIETIKNRIPNEKITPEAAKAIQKLVIEKANDTYSGEFNLEELPDAVWTQTDLIKQIIDGAEDPNFPYGINNIPEEILDQLGNKLPQYKDHAEKEVTRRANYWKGVEDWRQAEADKKASQEKEQTDAILATDPKEIDDKIRKQPNYILHIPKEMQTLDRWVLAASLNPFMVTCIHEPGLREKVKAELDKTGEAELQRIKKLSS